MNRVSGYVSLGRCEVKEKQRESMDVMIRWRCLLPFLLFYRSSQGNCNTSQDRLNSFPRPSSTLPIIWVAGDINSIVRLTLEGVAPVTIIDVGSQKHPKHLRYAGLQWKPSGKPSCIIYK